MRIVIISSDIQWEEWPAKDQSVEWMRVSNVGQFELHPAEAYFNLSDSELHDSYQSLNKPVIINSVIKCLSDSNASKNVIRINGWPGFLKKELWEVCGEISDEARGVFEQLNKKIMPVADEPGFIAARVVAMIINEAYFAVGENVSSREEIDIAMKLGTNYPFGPFEWAAHIGIKNVYDLLKRLKITDKRYSPATILEKEASSI